MITTMEVFVHNGIVPYVERIQTDIRHCRECMARDPDSPKAIRANYYKNRLHIKLGRLMEKGLIAIL